MYYNSFFVFLNVCKSLKANEGLPFVGVCRGQARNVLPKAADLRRGVIQVWLETASKGMFMQQDCASTRVKP